jgi:hypothetical protein
MLDLFSLRSRTGNIALGVAGILYVMFGLVVLVLHLAQSWGAASTFDRLLQLGMGGAAATGVFFLLVASHNLGGLPRLTLRRR